MFRPLAINVGLRYAGARESFTSFVSMLALFGLALSVAVLVLVQGVVAGFERELTTRVLGVLPHIILTARTTDVDHDRIARAIAEVPGIRGVSGILEGAGLLSTGKQVAGVSITGIDPEEYRAISNLSNYVNAEAAGFAPLEPGAFRVWLGSGVAERLQLAVGDEVFVVLPEASVTPLGVIPRRKRFEVTGILHTQSQLDRRAAFMHREVAARLFRTGGRAHGYHVTVDAPLTPIRHARDLRDQVVGQAFRILTWHRWLGDLHQVIRVTKNMLFLLLSLLVAVAAFNLVSSLVMVVNGRRGDIAIFRTMGSHSGLLLATFVFLGVLIAAVGVAAGIALGVGFGALAEAGFPHLERALDTQLMTEYFVSRLPMQFTGGDLARVAAMAMGLAVLATIYPAWRASKVNPAEVLQYE